MLSGKDCPPPSMNKEAKPFNKSRFDFLDQGEVETEAAAFNFERQQPAYMNQNAKPFQKERFDFLEQDYEIDLDAPEYGSFNLESGNPTY